MNKVTIEIQKVEGGYKASEVADHNETLEAYGATPAKIATATGRLIRRILEAKK